MNKKNFVNIILSLIVFIVLLYPIYAQTQLSQNKNPDFDNNGIVGYSDYFIFIDNFREPVTKETEKFDLNDDKEINKDDLSIFKDWFKVCNEDIICDLPRENHQNCPQDCPSGRKDNFCDKLQDGVCDWDCTAVTDIDCKKGPLSRFWLISFLPLIIILITIFIFYEVYTKHLERIQKHRDEELELKTYIMSSLNQGYAKQQIRNMLLKEGWSKKLVDEAFKTTEEPEKLSKMQLLELQNYILSTRRLKYTDKQIRNELKKDGWTDKQIDEAFNRLKDFKK